MQELIEDDGTNNLVQKLYSGEMDIEEVTVETIWAYLRAIQDTAMTMHNIPMVQGAMRKRSFREESKQ